MAVSVLCSKHQQQNILTVEPEPLQCLNWTCFHVISCSRISFLWFTDLFLKSEAWRVWTRWLLRGKLILDGNVVNLRRRKWLISKREVKQKSSFHTLPVSGWSTWVWFKSEQRDEFHHRVSGLKVTSYFTDYVSDQSQRSTCRSIYTHSLLVLNTSGWPK